jgi:hypothetical protein
MADTTTTNYGWTKPEVGASNSTWGTKLNADLDAVDAKVKAMDVATAAAKATLVDADIFGVYDSAASNVAKKHTWVQLKAALKTYLDASIAINDANWSGTDLAVANGGTGSSTAAAAAIALGVPALATVNTFSLLQTFSAGIQVDPAVGVKFGADDAIVYDDTTNTFSFNADGVAGTAVMSGYAIRLSSTADASLTSTGHGLQIGPTSGANLIMDANEIYTRNNGADGGTLYINNGVSFAAGKELAVTDGGTGAADAAAARANLGANNAANLTTGTLPNARLVGGYSFATLDLTGAATASQFVPTGQEGVRLNATADPYVSFYAAGVRQAYIQHTDGVAAGNGFRMYNDITDDYLYLSNNNTVDALKFYDGSTALHNTVFHSGNLGSGDVTTALGYTPASNAVNLTAGNGLTGGGTLAASRTFTLGTPLSITNSTGNTVGADDHTHALATTFAEVYAGTGNADVAFPLGHTVNVLCDSSSAIARNASATVRLDTGNTTSYLLTGAGTALTGTYRSRGWCGTGAGSNGILKMQRTA